MAIIEHFTMTEDHVKCLAAGSWEWSDYGIGAPAMSGKRPYGNSHSIGLDVAELCQWPEFDELDRDDDSDEGMEIYDALNKRGEEVHYGTRKALEIILQLHTFEPGEYTRIGDTWKRAGRSP